jgi:hypothetical protein
LISEEATGSILAVEKFGVNVGGFDSDAGFSFDELEEKRPRVGLGTVNKDRPLLVGAGGLLPPRKVWLGLWQLLNVRGLGFYASLVFSGAVVDATY